MKRALLLSLMLGILFVQCVSALTTTIKPSYAQGETMLIEIKGSIREPLQSSDVEFLRGHVQVGSFEYDLKRLGDRYFVYAISPFASNNYTLVIHGVETFVNGQAVTQDITENFAVTNETAPYTLRPGFALTNQDIPLTLTLNRDTPQDISISLENESLHLQPGLNTKVLSIAPFEAGLHMLSIGSYEFPLYSTRSTATTPPSFPRNIGISPMRIEERFIRTNEPHIITFMITNTAQRTLEDFVFEYDTDRYELAPSKVRSLKANKTATFNLTVLNEDADVSDTFRIKVENETVELPLEITFVEKNATPPPSNATLPPALNGQYHCAELNGQVCLVTQQCSGETVSTVEGSCCRGTCVNVEKKNSLAWLGYLVGAIVLFIIAVITGRYLKARSKSKEENPLNAQMKRLEKPF